MKPETQIRQLKLEVTRLRRDLSEAINRSHDLAARLDLTNRDRLEWRARFDTLLSRVTPAIAPINDEICDHGKRLSECASTCGKGRA